MHLKYLFIAYIEELNEINRIAYGSVPFVFLSAICKCKNYKTTVFCVVLGGCET
jgi:hypothetical protein